MKEYEIKDTDSGSFRNAIEFFADNGNEYSKEDLYSAFIVVTRLYLDELISARQLENLFVNRFGESAANEFFEAVANSSATVNEGEDAAAFENDPGAVIKNRFDIIEKLNREA